MMNKDTQEARYPMNHHTHVKIVLAVASAVAMALPVAPAMAQDNENLVWPPVSVVTRVRNGWIVAEGVVHNGRPRTLWRRPIAREGTAVSINQGWGSVFVQSDDRSFVIDSATGNVTELQPGEVVRQPPPFRRAEEEEPQPPPRETTPETLDPGPEVGVGQTLPPRENEYEEDTEGLSPERMEMLRQASHPTMESCQMDDPALTGLCRAQVQVLDALENLERVKRLYEARSASARDVQRAQNAVALARRAVDRAQVVAMRHLAPEMAMTNGEPGPQADPAVREAEKRVMGLLTQYNQVSAELRALQSEAATQPVEQGRLAELRVQQQQVAAQLDQAEERMRQLRLASAAPPESAEPLEEKLAQARQQLTQRNERYEQAVAEYERVSQAFDEGDASADAVDEAQNEMLQAVRQVSEARQRLESLREQSRLASDEELDQEQESPAGDENE
jgi:archaellum component FlaC